MFLTLLEGTEQEQDQESALKGERSTETRSGAFGVHLRGPPAEGFAYSETPVSIRPVARMLWIPARLRV